MLTSDAEIVATSLANRPLVGTTELRDDARGWRARLMYPIKTQNVVVDPPRFQVDTGPLLVPDPITATEPMPRFDLAHVVYNRLSQAELIDRRPLPVGEREGRPVAVTDYSVVETRPAVNQLWSSE